MALPLTIQKPLLFTKDGTAVEANQPLPGTQDPLIVKIAPLTRGANTVGITECKAFALYVYRCDSDTDWKLWSEQAKAWVPESTLPPADREAAPLEYKADDAAYPWQGQVMLMGAAGKFAESTGSYPQYAVRAAFTLTDGQSYQSEYSDPFLLPPPPDQNRPAGVKLKPDPEAPTWLELYLKDGSGNAGHLIIEQSGKVTLASKTGASITMENGELTVHGGKVKVDGEVTLTTGAGAAAKLNANSLELTAGGATVLLKDGNISLTPADPNGWILLNKRTKIEGQWQHPAV